eukprot:gb/GEZJ01000908.1/.p1 GENE.gb/GEZJ01000908.1/~~gb/GEZJ01000908.1/.p1  ORF type:complete len:1116 (+),score=144.66 gb/GEZJ01000908.1/:2931-6278(+)
MKSSTSPAKTTATAHTFTPTSRSAGGQEPRFPTTSNAEALSRATQVTANQAAFANAQAALASFPPIAQQEYARALAYQQATQIAAASQSQPSVAMQAPTHQPCTSQAGSQAQHISQAGVVPNTPGVNQRASQAFPAPIGIYAGNGVSQGIHHGVDTQGRNPLMADARARAGPMPEQYGLIAQMAAAVGVSITPVQLSQCTREQLAHFVGNIRARTSNLQNASISMRQQQNMRRVNEAQAHVNLNTAALDSMNAAKWRGQPGTQAAAAGQAVASSPSEVNRALAMQNRSLQHAGEQSLQYRVQQQQQHRQSAAMHGNAPALVAQMNRAPGLTHAHMNAILASQKAQQERTNAALQDQRRASAQAVQNVNQSLNVQAAAGTISRMVPSSLATCSVAPPVSVSGNAVPATFTHAEMFWNRLEDIQRKYKATFDHLHPRILKLQFKDEVRKDEIFKRLTDCHIILSLTRVEQVPEGVDFGVLQRTENFLYQLVHLYGLSTANHATLASKKKANSQTRAVSAAAAPAVAGGRPSRELENAQARAAQQRQAVPVRQQNARRAEELKSHSHLPNVQQQGLASPQNHSSTKINPRQQPSASCVPSRQNQAGIASSPAGVDVSKLVTPAQSQTQRHVRAKAVEAPRAGKGRVNGAAQMNVVSGTAGVGSAPTSARQEMAQVVAQMSTAGRGNSSSDVQMRHHTQTETDRPSKTGAAAQVQQKAARPGALESAVATHGQKLVGAQAQARTQAQADQHLRHRQAQQETARLPQQRATGAAAVGMRTNQDGAFANLESDVGGSSKGRKNMTQLEHRNSTSPGTNAAPGVTSDGRQGTANKSRAASGVAKASGAAAGREEPDPSGERNAALTPDARAMSEKNSRGKTGCETSSKVDATQRLKQLEAMVKDVTNQVSLLESWEAEAKRRRSERIRSALAALRKRGRASASDEEDETAKRGQKRRGSSADVENCEKGDEAIDTKAPECSTNSVLHLAKKPRHEPEDMQLLREAMRMDVEAVAKRNPRMQVKVIEEFGHPVVVCTLHLAEMQLPKLKLRVPHGYPRKGGATYGFERSPMECTGWIRDAQKRFGKRLSTASSANVATILDVWAREAEAAATEASASQVERRC